MKTIQVKVPLEIRVSDEDEETVREAIRDAMQEAIDHDQFEFEEEILEEDF